MHKIIINHEIFIMLVFAVGAMRTPSIDIYDWLIENVGNEKYGWELGTSVSAGGIINIHDDDKAVAFKLMFSEYIVND